ncbi:MAG: hypothetical protein JOY98_08790 [Candidatus Eremiobacteraeota bacterium]|nr:hypothetical protein [Candidatus Eremiobacteraeota bacterium]
MDNYVAIVFDDNAQAFDGLHELWDLDARGDLTVQGAVVVSRDKWGHIDVQTPDNETPGLRTGIGVGIGLLLGGLASTRLVIPNGAWAIIADVSEPSPDPLNTLAESLHARVFRRAKRDVARDARFSSDYGDYLYPYDYRPDKKQAG